MTTRAQRKDHAADAGDVVNAVRARLREAPDETAVVAHWLPAVRAAAYLLTAHGYVVRIERMADGKTGVLRAQRPIADKEGT